MSDIDTRSDNSSDITSCLIIKSKNKATAHISVIAIRDSDLSSSLQVMKHDDNDLGSSIKIAVIANNDLPSSLIVTGFNQLSSNIKVHLCKDLKSAIQIAPKNKMSGFVFKVIAGYDIDISSSIYILPYNNLHSSLFVKPDNEMEGIARIVGYGECNLKSSIHPLIADSMKSSIEIRPHNKMEGIVEIFQPPVFTKTLVAIRDSFIRSSLPRLNYGEYLDMFAGSKDGELFKSLLKFDISSVPTDKLLKKVTLVLDPTNYIDEDVQLNLTTIDEEWSESGVTWNSQPKAESFTMAINSGRTFDELHLDITQLFSKWYSNEVENHGILITLGQENSALRSFYTRHSNYKPKLIVEYFEPNIYSFGKTNIKSQLFVHAVGRKDLRSKISIKPTWWDSDLSSSINVRDPNIVKGSIFITKDTLPSQIFVVMYSDSSIPSNLVIRTNDNGEESLWLQSSIHSRANVYKDLVSSIAVKYDIHNDFASVLMVHYKDDISSSIRIRINANNNLLSTIIVHSTNDLESKIAVHNISKIISSLIVRQSPNANLLSKITIHNKNDLASSIEIKSSDILRSSIFVIHSRINNLLSGISVNKKSDLEGSLFVINSGLKSAIDIHQIIDIPSMMFIRPKDYKDLGSSIFVKPISFEDLSSSIDVRGGLSNDLISSIDIHYSSDLNSSIIIYGASNLPSWVFPKYTGESSLQGNLIPRVMNASDLQTYISIHQVSDLNSSIDVRGGLSNDLDSSIIIHHSSDINASIDVYNTSNLSSWLYIKFSEDNSLQGILFPRVTNTSNLNSSIIIYQIIDFPSGLTVRVKNENSINGNLIIRAEDKDDLASNIEILAHDNLSSNIFIRLIDSNDLVSTIVLHQASNLPSILILQHKYDLATSIVISNHNKMEGIVTIKRNQPPAYSFIM